MRAPIVAWTIRCVERYPSVEPLHIGDPIEAINIVGRGILCPDGMVVDHWEGFECPEAEWLAHIQKTATKTLEERDDVDARSDELNVLYSWDKKNGHGVERVYRLMDERGITHDEALKLLIKASNGSGRAP